MVKRCFVQKKVQLTKDRAKRLVKTVDELTTYYYCRHCNTYHVSSSGEHGTMIDGDNRLGQRFIKLIQEGKSNPVKKLSHRITIHHVNFGGIDYSVEYNKEQKTCRYIPYRHQQEAPLSKK